MSNFTQKIAQLHGRSYRVAIVIDPHYDRDYEFMNIIKDTITIYSDSIMSAELFLEDAIERTKITE